VEEVGVLPAAPPEPSEEVGVLPGCTVEVGVVAPVAAAILEGELVAVWVTLGVVAEVAAVGDTDAVTPVGVVCCPKLKGLNREEMLEDVELAVPELRLGSELLLLVLIVGVLEVVPCKLEFRVLRLLVG
jgi:hypothetical protein